MNDTFVYSWSSPSASAYIDWLGTIQNRRSRRRRAFAWIAACVFVAGIAFDGVVLLAGMPLLCLLVALGTSFAAAVLMTDTCRGYMFYEPVGAVIRDFSTINEFDIGRLEKNAMLGGLGAEVQKLLYCLRVSSNLPKYKKLDVMVARWRVIMDHGRPYFGASPRGKLTFDFLTQLYSFHMRRVLNDYAKTQYLAVSKLKTAAAKQRRLEKTREKLVEILTTGQDLPQMQELVNDAYRAIAEAARG